MRKASAAWTSAALETWIALITLTPVRRATSAQNEGPSSPFSCTIVSPAFSTAFANILQLGIDEHPDDLALTPKRSPDLSRVRRLDSAAGFPRSGSTRQPRRPSSTASAASSRLVIPQILTRIPPE